ncbi:hypothetical protein D3C71_1343350 [compost metagenome]
MADLQIIVGICHSEDAGPHRNHLPDQAIWISESIVPLMVAADDVGHRLHVIQRHQCLLSQNGMPSVLRSFFIGKLGNGFGQQGVRQGNLPNVMHEPCDERVLLIRFRHVHGPCGATGQIRHTARVAGELPTSPLHEVGKHLDGGKVVFLDFLTELEQLASARRDLFLQGFIQFHQGLVFGPEQFFQPGFFVFQGMPLKNLVSRGKHLTVIPRLGDVPIDFPAVDGRDG